MEIKDVLHFYIGQKVIASTLETGKLVGITESEYERGKTIALIDVGAKDFLEWYVEDVKPILRKLSDMTEEEEVEMVKTQDDVKLEGYPKIRLKVDSGETFRWLTSKGFDIFNLIDAELAIDNKSI